MDYRITYQLTRPANLRVEHCLTAREPVRNVLGSLTETLQLDPAAT